jgi:hypothetical protein
MVRIVGAQLQLRRRSSVGVIVGISAGCVVGVTVGVDELN